MYSVVEHKGEISSCVAKSHDQHNLVSPEPCTLPPTNTQLHIGYDTEALTHLNVAKGDRTATLPWVKLMCIVILRELEDQCGEPYPLSSGAPSILGTLARGQTAVRKTPSLHQHQWLQQRTGVLMLQAAHMKLVSAMPI